MGLQQHLKGWDRVEVVEWGRGGGGGGWGGGGAYRTGVVFLGSRKIGIITVIEIVVSQNGESGLELGE